jgi:hypothetical protein
MLCRDKRQSILKSYQKKCECCQSVVKKVGRCQKVLDFQPLFRICTYSHSMMDVWLCLYIGVFWYKISHYLVFIIHIILFYHPFGVQKLVTVLGKYSSDFALLCISRFTASLYFLCGFCLFYTTNHEYVKSHIIVLIECFAAEGQIPLKAQQVVFINNVEICCKQKSSFI